MYEHANAYGRSARHFSLRASRQIRYCFPELSMKPKIYKMGSTWILWVPGIRVYRFTSWNRAISYALDPSARQR